MRPWKLLAEEDAEKKKKEKTKKKKNKKKGNPEAELDQSTVPSLEACPAPESQKPAPAEPYERVPDARTLAQQRAQIAELEEALKSRRAEAAALEKDVLRAEKQKRADSSAKEKKKKRTTEQARAEQAS